jgi:Domain of unknown function (DUF4375)
MHSRMFYHAKKKEHWGFTIEDDTVVIRFGKAGALKEKREKCDSPVDAIAMANGEEFERVRKSWRLTTDSAAPRDGELCLKPLWAGSYSELTGEKFELYDYTSYAASRIDTAWEFENADMAAWLTREASPATLALWTIQNADGQICNGGFSQFFFNSYGELAEEALVGFRYFGMNKYADLLDEAYVLFLERPIPKDRDERIGILDAMAEEANPEFLEQANKAAASDSSGLAYFSAMAKGTAAYWDDLETRYYALIHAKIKHKGYNAAFYLPLCQFIDTHREDFFQMPA